MFSKTLIAAFAAFATVNAHLAMQVPSPIPGTETKSPLDPSGSDFPCHGADLSGGTSTSMAIGSSQPLHFNLGGGANTAVHGGGSCQISLTYETDATARKNPANWKVIHSFVGGCPTDAKGNLGTSVECPLNDPQCVNSFNFTIPVEAKADHAILAWTWFNNVGNREMYMNCAKVSITGTGSGDLNSLPSLFVANLASINQCKTTENFNTDFPNPGKYITKDSVMNFPLKAPAGSCDAGSGSGSVASSPASGSGSGSAAAASAASSPATTSKASNPGGVFAPGAAAAATTLATQVVPAAATPAAQTPAAPATVAPVAASQPAAAPASSGSCPAGSLACTTPGFYCIDTLHFGMCAFGCAIPQQLAAGTNCVNGAIAFAPAQSKRSPIARVVSHARRASVPTQGRRPTIARAVGHARRHTQ